MLPVSYPMNNLCGIREIAESYLSDTFGGQYRVPAKEV